MEENTRIARPRNIQHERAEVHLRPAALAAVQWWNLHSGLALNETDYAASDRKRMAAIEARAEEDRALAHLIDVARTLPLADRHRWDVTVRIADEHDRIAPLPKWESDYRQSDDDTCRHGRSFDVDCADCEI